MGTNKPTPNPNDAQPTKRPRKPRAPRPPIDGETWLRQQLAGLEIPTEAPDPDEALLRCLAFVHLVYHYGPAERWAAIERCFEGLIPDYQSPALWKSPAMRWWLEKQFLAQDVLLASVRQRHGGGE
jgi:hypothetical protein